MYSLVYKYKFFCSMALKVPSRTALERKVYGCIIDTYPGMVGFPRASA